MAKVSLYSFLFKIFSRILIKKALSVKMRTLCETNCNHQCKKTLPSEIVEANIETYFKINDKERKLEFIASRIEPFSPIAGQKRKSNETAASSIFYIDGENNKRISVCRLFFKRTYNISNEDIETAFKKKKYEETSDKAERDRSDDELGGKSLTSKHCRIEKPENITKENILPDNDKGAETSKIDKREMTSSDKDEKGKESRAILSEKENTPTSSVYIRHINKEEIEKKKNEKLPNLAPPFSPMNYYVCPGTIYGECSVWSEFSKAQAVRKETLKEKYDTHVRETAFSIAANNADILKAKAKPNHVVAHLKMWDPLTIPMDIDENGKTCWPKWPAMWSTKLLPFSCLSSSSSSLPSLLLSSNSPSLSLTSTCKLYIFTICTPNNKMVYYFMWPEWIGTDGISEIGSCILKFIEHMVWGRYVYTDFVFYSDSFRGKEEWDSIISFYSATCEKNWVRSIKHKFFVGNHNIMTVDDAYLNNSFEAMKKTELKDGKIFTPKQYSKLIKAYAPAMRMFFVEMESDDFRDLRKLSVDSRVVFSKHAKPQGINYDDLKIIQIHRNDSRLVSYKFSFSHREPYKKIFFGLKNVKPLYDHELPISEYKIERLLRDLHCIRQDPHFYKSMHSKYNIN